MKKVAIIGGGLGGLASACVLAARGYEVVVFERNEWLGGKAAVLKTNGFRFDGAKMQPYPKATDGVVPAIPPISVSGGVIIG
jgi:phytoene dehydrogenase-like protein